MERLAWMCCDATDVCRVHALVNRLSAWGLAGFHVFATDVTDVCLPGTLVKSSVYMGNGRMPRVFGTWLSGVVWRSLCICPAQSHHFHRIEQFSFCCDAMSNRASHWGLATCAVTFGHVLYHAEKQHCNDFRRPAATSGDHPVQICGSLQHLIHEIPVAAGYIGASAWVQYPECSLQHAVWLLSTPAPIAWLTGVVCVFVIRSRISVDRRGEELRVPCSLASQHGLAHVKHRLPLAKLSVMEVLLPPARWESRVSLGTCLSSSPCCLYVRRESMRERALLAGVSSRGTFGIAWTTFTAVWTAGVIAAGASFMVTPCLH